MSLNRFFSVVFVLLNIMNISTSLFMTFYDPGSYEVGLLNSALPAAVAALWFAVRWKLTGDVYMRHISLPYVVMFTLAIFGIGSYLFVAAISAAYIYLHLSYTPPTNAT